MKFRKTLAVLATAVLVGLGIAVPMSASAHHTTIYGSAVCNTDTGLFDATWTVENWQPGNPATITASSRASVPVGATIDQSQTFSEAGLSAGTHSLSVSASWPNGQYSQNSGQITTQGDCQVSIPEKPEPLSGTDSEDGPAVCVEPKNGTATITTTKTDWTQDYTWDESTRTWVLGEKVYVVTTSERTVDSEECEPPVVVNPANPVANVTAVCGEATVTFTNPLIAGAEQLTASFVVNVNGEFKDAYSVEAGGHVSDTYTFTEDTGNYKVEVFQAGTSEWKKIAEGTVTSDCEEPPVVVPPVEPPVVVPPVEPPVEEPPAEKPPVEIAEGEEFLAYTGLDGADIALLIVAGLLVTGVGTALVVSARKKAKQ